MAIEVVVYQALADVEGLELPPGVPHSGKVFEDFMVQQLYQRLQQRGEFGVFPPRYTLREPTYSGVAHQFDIVVRQDELTAIECKFREKAGIDELFAFAGKLVDYRRPPSAIFVTTASKVADEILCYAIAHRIHLVCSQLPPVECMITRVKRDTDLFHRLAGLQERLQDDVPPRHLLIEWRNAYKRFTQEGYI